MKYFQFEHCYDKIPYSKNNLLRALERIGEIDPFKIKRTTLYRMARNNQCLNSDKLINRGILNVRFSLNRHLGKSGKFSCSMIRNAANIIVRGDDNAFFLKAKLPKENFIRIVHTTYMLLWLYDKKFCEELLKEEARDEYMYKNFYINPVYKTTAPIQTNLIIRSEGHTTEVKKFINFMKENLDGGQ